MTFKKGIKRQIEEAEEEINNNKEAILLLNSAIKSDYLSHEHNLTCQIWVKEYDQRIEYLKNFLEGAYNEQ